MVAELSRSAPGRRRSTSRRARRATVLLSVALALAPLPVTGAGAQAPPAPAADASGATSTKGQSELEDALLAAVRDADFGSTIDFGPLEDVCPGARFCASPARPVEHMPNVDLAVIELDEHGRATRAANVLLSRDHALGVVVPVDLGGGPAGSYGVSSVRWRRWDIERYDGGTFDPHNGRQLTVTGWSDDPPLTDADDIVPGRQGAALEFMSPYPASLFKLVVAFRIMRLVDDGQLGLDQLVSWDPTPGNDAPSTPPPLEPAMELRGERALAPPAHDTVTRPLRTWLDAMITFSDNDSARALLKLLWDLDDLPAMHAELRDLGLGTLQVEGTDPATGRNWLPGRITMTSMDTARLLWLIDGGDGRLWERPDGSAVTASILSDSSRTFLRSLLEDQGYHEALSTTNLCGAPNVEPGIPARVPGRWVDPRDGTVTVDVYPYGRDVRPCNAAAEVTFAHKTGETYNYGADAGIVHSLPGEPSRHYVISFIASLGYRYTDAVFAARPTLPCYDPVGPICYTQRIPAMARQIDAYLASSS